MARWSYQGVGDSPGRLPYADCTLETLGSDATVSRALLQEGLTREHLRPLARKVGLQLTPVDLAQVRDPRELPLLISLRLAFQDPHVHREPEKGAHWVLVVGQDGPHLVVADPHPWNPALWLLPLERLDAYCDSEPKNGPALLERVG